MTNLACVLQKLKKEHDRLTKEMKAISAALSDFGAAYGKGTAARGGMSAAGRARIAAAQRARWAKVKAKGENANVVTMPKKRTMSAAPVGGFRHSLCSFLMAEGENPAVIQATLRHTRLDMTMYCAHSRKKLRLEAQSRVLEAVLGGERGLQRGPEAVQ